MPRKIPNRRINVQKDDTLGRIFKHAMRLFLRKGYHGTTIDDIIKAAGYSKGAFYWHFDSKEHILRQIIREYEERRLDAMIKAV
jgi:AcrR family transcriptional regulator